MIIGLASFRRQAASCSQLLDGLIRPQQQGLVALQCCLDDLNTFYFKLSNPSNFGPYAAGSHQCWASQCCHR